MQFEKDIEAQLVAGVERLGGLCKKVGDDGWPDRLCILPRGLSIWVELKRPDGRRSKLQEWNVARLQRLGHDARFLESSEAVEEFLRELKNRR